MRQVPCPKDTVLVQCGKLEVRKSVEKREQDFLCWWRRKRGWIKEMDSDFEKRLLTPRSVFLEFSALAWWLIGVCSGMEGVGPQMWLELRRVKMLTRSLRYQLENYHCFNIIEGNLELFHIIIFRCSREWPGVSSPQSIPHRRSSSSLLLIISFLEYVVITSQISSHDEKERSLSNLAHCKFNPPL